MRLLLTVNFENCGMLMSAGDTYPYGRSSVVCGRGVGRGLLEWAWPD